MDGANPDAMFPAHNTYHDEQAVTNHQQMVDPEQDYNMSRKDHCDYGLVLRLKTA